jgi:Lipocalin-like domain
MYRRQFLAGTAALAPLLADAAAPTLRERLLGAWRIVDAETVNVKTGTSAPWLGRPRPYTGLIMYLATGYMSVQIGAARPAARDGLGFGELTGDELRAYAETWYGYYGRFEVDEAKAQVRHILEGSLFGFETGLTYVRDVRLDGDRLTLKTVDRVPGPDGDTFNRLVWKRA